MFLGNHYCCFCRVPIIVWLGVSWCCLVVYVVSAVVCNVIFRDIFRDVLRKCNIVKIVYY